MLTPIQARAMLRAMPDDRYRGLSYEAASHTGEALIKAALESGYWFNLPEHLTALREVMNREAVR